MKKNDDIMKEVKVNMKIKNKKVTIDKVFIKNGTQVSFIIQRVKTQVIYFK